jgi:hypothetical protein
VREYRNRWGLTVDRAGRLKADALIMHPGPMNRGVEIDPAVADDARSVVLDQVAAGVPTRMAVLYRLLGPGQFDPVDDDRASAADTGHGGAERGGGGGAGDGGDTGDDSSERRAGADGGPVDLVRSASAPDEPEATGTSQLEEVS